MYSKRTQALLASALALTPVGGLCAALPGFSDNEQYLVKRQLKTGLGTRYCPNGNEEDCWQDGACAFVNYDLPAGIDGSTCVSEQIWDSAAHCGKCIEVTYQGKKLKIMVTNKTDGDANHLDMPPATWKQLTNGMSGGGVDGIQWQFIDCPITTPLLVQVHGGGSKYWPAVTIENATQGTTKVEFSDDGGNTWHASTRDTNNFFVMDGTLSKDTASVRITSEKGKTVVVENVQLKSGVTTKASKNFS